MEKTGLIYSIQRYCIHDGPGIRTNIFFKGCQLRCPWCANPESQHKQRELSFVSHKCTQCGLCIEKCPQNALRKEKNGRINRKGCDLCGLCVRCCPADCYQIFGREVTVAELLEEVERDLPFYQNSGGGVTVTGGEPTLQPEFLTEFLYACKTRGIDTAMETHGNAPAQVMEQLAPAVDHFLVDIKCMDSGLHERVIGEGNQRTLENIRLLAGKLDKEVSLRVPCIPGFNLDEKNKRALAVFAKEIEKTGNLHRIHLLPYHNLGLSKYEALDREYAYKDMAALRDEELAQYETEMRNEGLPVTIGG